MNNIIKRALFTEKGEILKAVNRYMFEVDKKANKIQIRKAVESIFNVKVEDVKTSIIKPTTKIKYGKPYRTSYMKKAIVKLASGSQINFNI